ncbi:hypothetical protein [Rhizobium lusitanum]|uniref:Uncharacterized protein n=1 Tax=Rhizobium lusitanum TaxID=293958 RepID=A0A1C3VSG5_9HYPH|nr:hypothetical protein [Rhizobium lusitanum]SCB30741.1 hypothetical protein GA0061101_106150 [Rhizobium lusitanum]
MLNEPIAHLVWLQGRRAADDVEDYYEVARAGDKSVDGSDPFPVYASPSDAERHERAPKSEMLEIAVAAVLEADKEFRSNMPSDWEGDPLSDELDGLRRIVEALSDVPSPPAAVQEPVAVKAVAWRCKDFADGWILDASERSAREYQKKTGCVMQPLYAEPPAVSVVVDNISDEQLRHIADSKDTAACRSRIRSALSNSQSDPAPEIACPCTTFEQDEDCPVGQPSLLCSACGGKGIVPIETVVALAAEMLKVAEQVDELEDPFAAWESIELFNSHHNQMQKALCKIAGMVDDEDADLDDAISIANAALPVQDPPPPPEIAALRAENSNAHPANQIIGQIEELFPDWRSYRDLIDCIECTLHELRKGSRS